MRHRRRVALMLAVLATSSCASGSLVAQGSPQVPLPTMTLHTGEGAVPSGVSAAATMLTELLGDEQSFGHVALGDSGSLVLSWHGEPPGDALETVAREHPEVTVTVAPVEAVPGRLRDIAAALVATKAHLGVGAASVEKDYATIVVEVGENVQDYDALAQYLTREVGFPVRVGPGAPAPAVGLT